MIRIYKQKYNIVSGEKFGKWILIERDEELSRKKKSQVWICQCECGTKRSIRYYDLLRKETTQCLKCYKISPRYSMMKEKNASWKGYKEISGSLWSSIVRGAESRNLKLDIDIKYIWNLFVKQNRRCSLTGLELNFGISTDTKLCTASLDRIDSNKGYIRGNVQWIYKKINLMKMNLDEKEFIYYCKLISEYNK